MDRCVKVTYLGEELRYVPVPKQYEQCPLGSIPNWEDFDWVTFLEEWGYVSADSIDLVEIVDGTCDFNVERDEQQRKMETSVPRIELFHGGKRLLLQNTTFEVWLYTDGVSICTGNYEIVFQGHGCNNGKGQYYKIFREPCDIDSHLGVNNQY